MLYHPYMLEYTNSRNGIPENIKKDLDSKKNSTTLKVSRSTAEIVTDLINNTKTPELGYIDPELNYKKGVRPKKLKEQQKKDTQKRLSKFEQKDSSAEEIKPQILHLDNRSQSITIKRTPANMNNI